MTKFFNKNKKLIKTIILPEYSDEIMIGQCRCLPGPGTIFRKSAALKIGGRDTKWKYVGDYDFWLRLSTIGKISRLPGVLAQWRQNQNSTSVTQRGSQMANERIAVMSNFLEKNPSLKHLRKRAISNSYFLAARLVFFDSRVEGRKFLFKSFRVRKGWPEIAKISIVLYILLMPVSSILLKPFKSLLVKLYAYK